MPRLFSPSPTTTPASHRSCGRSSDGVTLIVVEATGGLERPLVDALLDAELPVALVNSGHVRHFAKGIGILAKTDVIDAHVLVATRVRRG